MNEEKYRLIRRDGDFPPSNYVFVDPRTGMKFDGIGFDRTVQEIIKHRKSNPTIYPTAEGKWTDYESVAIELEIYTCRRLGNNDRYCKQAQPIAAYAATPSSGECPDCHVTLEPVYCATCSGKRITGYSCPNCKRSFGK